MAERIDTCIIRDRKINGYGYDYFYIAYICVNMYGSIYRNIFRKNFYCSLR